LSQVATKSTTIGRSSGKISITLGVLTRMEVKLYVSCSESPGSGLNQACPDCLSPALAPRVCETHGTILAPLAKVYRDGDNVFQITEDDLAAMKLETAKNFVPIAMVKVSAVPDLLTEASKKYFLVPEGFTSGLIYAALTDHLTKTRSVIIGKYSLNSGRENLAAILPDEDDGMLTLIQLPFPDIRRPKPELSLPVVTEPVQKGMKIILNNMPTTFDYDACQDDYDAALQLVILKKTSGKIVEESTAIQKLTSVTKGTENQQMERFLAILAEDIKKTVEPKKKK